LDEAESAGGKKIRGKVVVVMPAYQAERTIERAFREIPSGAADEVLAVDDASRDGTSKTARELGVRLIIHPRNLGYGASQKTCYNYAIESGADIIVMLHADAQYDASVIPLMTSAIASGDADLVLGSRMKIPGDAKKGGMPFSKIVVNGLLTSLENFFFGTRLTDMHTGYRAFSREFLESVPFMKNSDGFLFDSQMLAQAAAFKARILEIPVKSRYFNEASSIGFFNGSIYTLGTLLVVLQFILLKTGVFVFSIFRMQPATDRSAVDVKNGKE